MKRWLVFICILWSSTAFAQSKFIGSWEGILNAGSKQIKLVFHIKQDNGQFSGTMDSPDQGAFGLNCSSVVVSGDTVTLSLSKIGITYRGALSSNDNITGIFSQGGGMLPLALTRQSAKDERKAWSLEGPANYTSEDLVYHNKDNSIQYGATITIPQGKGPFPAVLLITGSGLQNRDEELMGHKPFATIAHYLSNRGYVVLRVDDRTMGKSTGDIKNVTTADFAQDVMTSLDYLESRKEVNKKKVGLLGHSEGGMIAEMVAAKRKDLDFIILDGGPGVKTTQLMEEQNKANFMSVGVDEATAEKYIVLYRQMVQDALNDKDSAQFRAQIAKDVRAWVASTDPSIVASVTPIHDEATEKSFVDLVVSQFSIPWMRYFLAYDPAPVLKQISCKVLAIGGGKDIQVVASSNLAGIKKGLEQSKSKSYEVKELPGLNHLMQKCDKCTIGEYAQIQEDIDPLALQTISDWLDKNVK